jgi:hypothetical protein
VLTRKNLWAIAFDGSVDDMREPHVPLLRWCVQQNLPVSEDVSRLIGATGSLTLIDDYLAAYGRMQRVPVFSGAACVGKGVAAVRLAASFDANELRLRDTYQGDVSMGGIVELAQLIYGDPRSFNNYLLLPALERGHLEFVQWVLAGTTLAPVDAQRAVSVAARSGSIDLVRWLVEEHHCPKHGNALRSAAWEGHMDMVFWLREQGVGTVKDAVDGAARGGQIHVLEWAIEQGGQLTEDILYVAAESANAATVGWLLDRGCPYDEKTLVMWACCNWETDEVLKLLIGARGMQFDYHTCSTTGYETSDLFDEGVLHRVGGGGLNVGYFESCVHSGDLGRVRYALEHNAHCGPNELRMMFEADECAMLKETVQHYTVDGLLTDEVRSWLDEAVYEAGTLVDSIKQVLARSGYQVA